MTTPARIAILTALCLGSTTASAARYKVYNLTAKSNVTINRTNQLRRQTTASLTKSVHLAPGEQAGFVIGN